MHYFYGYKRHCRYSISHSGFTTEGYSMRSGRASVMIVDRRREYEVIEKRGNIYSPLQKGVSVKIKDIEGEIEKVVYDLDNNAHYYLDYCIEEIHDEKSKAEAEELYRLHYVPLPRSEPTTLSIEEPTPPPSRWRKWFSF